MRRRARSLLFAAVLLLALCLAPIVDADKGKGRDKDARSILRLPLGSSDASDEGPQDDDDGGAGRDAGDGDEPSSSLRTPAALGPESDVRIPVTAVSLALMGAGAGMLLLLSLLAARRARRPKTRAPPKRSFESGRAMGRLALLASEAQAASALQTAPVGRLVAYERTALGPRVTMQRGRSEPCDLVAGYLTGLFEAAWASDVIVRHDACGGKGRSATCCYDVRRVAVPGRVTPVGGRTGEEATLRSGAATRRSPPARPGAG